MNLIRIITVLIVIDSKWLMRVNCANEIIKIKFIEQFLSYDKLQCVKLNLFLCWSQAEKINLTTILFNLNYQVSVFNTNITDIPNGYDDFNMLFILDLDCMNSSNVLQRANHQILYKFPYKWLLLTEDPQISDRFTQEFTQLDIYPDSNVLIAQKTQKNQFILTDIYRYAPYRKELIKTVILHWTEEENFGKFQRRNVSSERTDLNGTMLKSSIVIIYNDTINHLTDYRDTHIDSVTKVSFPFTNILINYTNAITEYYFVPTWGYRDKNNSYTGMIGLMQQNKVEIGGTALLFTPDRIPIIDYIAMTTATTARFVFRQPPLSYQSNIFTLPFSRTLWISSFALIGLFIILLYLAVYMEWRQPGYPETENALRASILDAVMVTFSAVAQQGSNTEPRGAAGKIVMIFAFIALMFLYVSYSANIVALLQSSATDIKTLQDLLESRLTLGSDEIVFHKYYFKTAFEPIRKAIYQKKIAPPGEREHFYPLAEGIKKIRKGFYAFHMETGPGYKLMSDTFFEHEKCGLQEIKYLDTDNIFYSIRKNSSYKKILKIGLRKIHESGLQNCEKLRIYTKKPECHTGGGSFVSVGLLDAYAAFLFLGVGIGISVGLFLIEVIINKRKNKK